MMRAGTAGTPRPFGGLCLLQSVPTLGSFDHKFACNWHGVCLLSKLDLCWRSLWKVAKLRTHEGLDDHRSTRRLEVRGFSVH